MIITSELLREHQRLLRCSSILTAPWIECLGTILELLGRGRERIKPGLAILGISPSVFLNRFPFLSLPLKICCYIDAGKTRMDLRDFVCSKYRMLRLSVLYENLQAHPHGVFRKLFTFRIFLRTPIRPKNVSIRRSCPLFPRFSPQAGV